jgi:stage V sporulation protein D (sporulation-specific penicillin-binding protein)
MGFAPADDPEILVLLAYDRPRRAAPGASNSTTGWYISGGQMAAPMAGDLIAKIMDYKNVEKQYSGDESGSADVSMPRATGQPLSQAIEALEKKGLGYRTVGEGDTVTAQIPGQGTMLASGSTVILYLGDESPEMSECIVPNVRGLGYDAARARLEAAGFYMRSSGSGMQDASSTAHSQSLEAGETAPLGTVISVSFIAKVEDGYVYTG